MSPRPNPTQNTQLDERHFRQLAREYAPAGRAVDKDDLARAFSESNQRSWAIVIRRAALDWVRENMPARFIVRPGFAEELRAYFEGEGELPADAAAIRGEDVAARRLQRAMDPQNVVGGGGDLELDEEGRAPGQEPSGRFARAGDPRFDADRR